MSRLKRGLLVLVVFLSALIVFAFVLENQQSVSLLFLGLTGPQLPVSIVVVAALLTGMIIGPVIRWLFGNVARMRRK
ncbi:DUF1049 domain-containing protein [Pseudomonas sp. PCH199]|uniref:lipopolysaccharide assembly protein LapA domain-containing protein n=1 Tax=unclassified Pseudomonas TaxID=196821 RepID=UPI000BCAAEC1|nr:MULTISPECIES: lipopolysaccharide assembly protein LapA domain-containing protein [unclassified Pseudomonas]MCW8276797.1 DUF1049 domain-containing protein [Pseudomonas sp. PCH199]PAM83079.1 hypothetical protein CES87_15165 [Pseudomonas sp. ERMR1:02]